MADLSKLQALRDACARDAGLRARLERAPDGVLREYGVVLGRAMTPAALITALLADELTEDQLAAVAGGAFDAFL